MKVALLGTGKTGKEVAKLALKKDDVIITEFNRNNPISLDKLQGHDVIISFLTGDVFLEHIELLIESKIPVVTGSTGFKWPENIHGQLKEAELTWIRSHNFSLGMNIVKAMIQILSKASNLLSDTSTSIHEIHHTKKLDGPSGTALSWQEWFGSQCEISFEREGDVVGFHKIELNSPTETITLSHDAKDRSIFAEGALWAANIITTKDFNNFGLYEFNDVVKDHLKI